jgi:predicted aconitase with swiveling domain
MILSARHAIGKSVAGTALVARDGFSARYDLDRVGGTFSRPAHQLAGQSFVGRILVLDTAKGGVASAWMLREMALRGVIPLALVFNSVNPILVQGAAFGDGEAIDRMNTSGSEAYDCIRTRSPRRAPPVIGDDGSTATTATARPAVRSAPIIVATSVDLPAPGGPVIPTRWARSAIG